MNKDFHLYGTYMAAIIAGYSDHDALEVACAAQEVDEFDSGKTVDSCPTVTSTGLSLVWTFLTTYFSNGSKRVFDTTDTWMPFHFIPKNAYDRESSENISVAFRCGYGEPMKQVCQHIVPGNKYSEKNITNERIGITMHVLADSFAHKQYCGVLSYNPRIAKNLKVRYGSEQAGYMNEDGLGIHVPVWMSGALSGIFYFGHGSSGHVPDLSWAIYCHQWKYDKDQTEVRNNTDLFLKAFSEMINVLKSARSKNDEEIAASYREEQVAEFVKATCERTRRDRSNGMDRNMVIEDVKMMEYDAQELGHSVDYDQMLKVRYIKDDDTVAYKEERLGALLNEPYYDLSLGVQSDNVFRDCLVKLGGEETVGEIDARYRQILKSESKCVDFEEAAKAHKQAVYEAVGITRKDLRAQLSHQEFTKALRPAGLWD